MYLKYKSIDEFLVVAEKQEKLNLPIDAETLGKHPPIVASSVRRIEQLAQLAPDARVQPEHGRLRVEGRQMAGGRRRGGAPVAAHRQRAQRPRQPRTRRHLRHLQIGDRQPDILPVWRSRLVGSDPETEVVDLPVFPLERQRAVQVEAALAPHGVEGHLGERVPRRVHLPPAGTKLLDAETKRRAAVLQVERLGLVDEPAAHAALERDDRVEGGDRVVKDITAQAVLERAGIGGRRRKNGESDSLRGRVRRARTKRLADQSVMTELIDR